MTILDDTLPAKIVATLATYGKDVTLTDAPTAGDYDPATGTVTDTPLTQVVKSAPPYAYDRRFINGATVREGDARLMVAASGLTVTPTAGMVAVFDSLTWNVVSVQPIYSGENIAAYEMQVRK